MIDNLDQTNLDLELIKDQKEQDVKDILFEANPQYSYISKWEDLGDNNTKLKPSIIESPQLELKKLLEHSKYVFFLGENNTLL